MSSNDTSGPIPIRYRHANPLLFTLQQDHMTIQPYWIMVLEILAIQLLQRLWNLWHYGMPLSTIEIGFIRWVLWVQITSIKQILEDVDDDLNRYTKVVRYIFQLLMSLVREYGQNSIEKRTKLLKKLNFDLFDFIFYFLPLVGHGVWYCYIQSSCMSAKDATVWNCYNAFGYRLYNYIFVSYANFFWVFVIKSLARHEEGSPTFKIWTLKWFNYKLGLWSSRITFIFNGCLVLPYLLTNVIPMMFTYPFMTIIYGALWFAISFFAIYIWDETPVIRKLLPIPGIILMSYRKLAMVLYMLALATYTYPILMTTLYNYSQYLYYGENYIYTMSNEFDMRDTARYIEIFQNSTNEKFHTSLNFI